MTDVVIVGGGAAGIAAARRLAAHGVDTLLLEAAPTLGGRARTVTAEGLALDLGCGWLHSADRNPWASIACDAAITVDRRTPAWGSQYRDLGFPAEDQEHARAAMSVWYERLASSPAGDSAASALPDDATWHPYIRAMAGFISGTEPEAISATDFMNYDQASTGCNWRVATGYGALVASSLPAVTAVRCSTVVESVNLSAHGVSIATNAGTISAPAAILTVSTAVLAGDALRLPTALAPWRDAARALPLGRNEKLFLGIASGAPFEDETMVFGDPRDVATGAYYICPLGSAVIECFLGGASADRLASEGVKAACAAAVDELAGLFGSSIRRHLRLLAGSNWKRSSWIGGGYSCALPGTAEQRQRLAKPFEERIFFAGEATSATDFSTAHGAFTSGVRAADEAMSMLNRLRR